MDGSGSWWHNEEALGDGSQSESGAEEIEMASWAMTEEDAAAMPGLDQQEGGADEMASWAMTEKDAAAIPGLDQQEGGAPQVPLPAKLAASAARDAAKPASTDRQAKKQRRHYGRSALSAEQVEELLLQDLPARPLVLDVMSMPQVQSGGWVFKETGRRTRPAKKNADKWRRGGGTSDAIDLPSAQEPRVRRRYGYVVPQREHGQRLRYHQYCRVSLSYADTERAKVEKGGSLLGVVEDTNTWLFHVLPEASQVPPAPPKLFPQPGAKQEKRIQQAPQLVPAAAAGARSRTTHVLGALHVDAQAAHPSDSDSRAILHLKSKGRAPGQTTDFVHFEEADAEVGGIYHSDNGLQIRSASGDFAEWHPALDPSELPFAEGSVVGIFGGSISSKTADADMVAVVSRRAMCVGSFPGKDKATLGDIVAYLGQVPVRVRGHVASGDVLVPSMVGDGVAMSSRAADNASKPHAVAIGVAMSAHVPMAGSQSEGTVNVLITPPSAQQQQQQRGEPVEPANDFANLQKRSAKNTLGRYRCLACLSIGIVLSVVFMHAISSMAPTEVHQSEEQSARDSDLPDAEQQPRAEADRNNCSTWSNGCEPHGECVAARCECQLGYGGASCEDSLCVLTASVLACSTSLNDSSCLPLGGSIRRREEGVCWPAFYQIGMLKPSTMSFKSPTSAAYDLMDEAHADFLGLYKRLDGWSCADMPVYKLDGAWNCSLTAPYGYAKKTNITNPSKCVIGTTVPSFLFMGQTNVSRSRYWAIGLGSASSNYTEPDCDSKLMVYTNSIFSSTPAAASPYLPYNNDPAYLPWGKLDASPPCYSNPSARGCDRGWQECMDGVMHSRDDGLTGCQVPWDGFVLWHNVATLAVRPR